MESSAEFLPQLISTRFAYEVSMDSALRRRRTSFLLATAAVVVGCAALVAAPWLRQDLVAAEWIGLAVGLACLRHLTGWRGEGAVLLASIAAIATAFHWSPKVLAYAMNTSDGIGLLVAIPIICWDAMRLALPFWCAGRLARAPVEAWIPAGLAAVVAESVMPGVFPWKLGYSQIHWTPLVQAVDLFGPEWATLMVFAHAGALVFLADQVLRLTPTGSRLAGAGRWPAAGVLAVVLCLVNLAYGLASVRYWEGRAAAAPSARIALIQSNPEDVGGVDALRSLTEELCSDPDAVPDLVCWPECSGGSYEEGLGSLADRQQVFARSRDPNRGMRPLDQPRCPLLFGGKVFRGFAEKPEALYQSAIIVDASNAIRGYYHKRHLMPFGEYVPGSDWYPELKLYFPMQDDFTTGSEATVLGTGADARIGVMLCYEDMIPGTARSLVRNSANVLVSLINGAAFTEPLTLAQHRLLAQLRAVEQRRSFVRCAATGETCFVTVTGAIAARLPVQGRDLLVVDVPLVEDRTVYSRIGPAFPIACGVLLATIAVGRRRAAAQPLAGR